MACLAPCQDQSAEVSRSYGGLVADGDDDGVTVRRCIQASDQRAGHAGCGVPVLDQLQRQTVEQWAMLRRARPQYHDGHVEAGIEQYAGCPGEQWNLVDERGLLVSTEALAAASGQQDGGDAAHIDSDARTGHIANIAGRAPRPCITQAEVSRLGSMQEHARMMAAFSAVQAGGGVCVLVTVVGTHGSSYRSPGARMLILPDGSRIGAVSGGCLEGELCRRAHWWTSESPAVLKTFDTSTQEDNEGFGLGCGGGIDLLLERLGSDTGTTHPLLAQQRVTESRVGAAVAVVLEATATSGLRVGDRFAADGVQQYPEVAALLERAVAIDYSFTAELREGALAGSRVFFESLTPPVQLVVCGAGTDAQPVVAQAAALGWSVVVLDQRADFARELRFPEAEQVIVAKDAAALEGLRFDRRTAAIVMSHSFAQDTFFLESLLARPLGYLGVLGSRRRTLDLLARLGRDAMPPDLHAPAGLDIGAETPEQIALSILSEVQASFARRTGGALRDRDGSIHGREIRGDTVDEPVRVQSSGECGLL